MVFSQAVHHLHFVTEIRESASTAKVWRESGCKPVRKAFDDVEDDDL